MKIFKKPALSGLFLFLLPAFLSPSENYFNSSSLPAIIQQTVAENYDGAAFLVEQNKTELGDALTHFLHAGILQARMQDYKSHVGESQFNKHIQTAIACADSQLQHIPDNLTFIFIKGAAIGYQSFQQANDKKYLKSLMLASESTKLLAKVISLDPQFYDAYVGLGNYYYWRSKVLKGISWLPFVEDRRQQGIELLLQCAKNGRLSKWAAISNLGWIYIYEGKYEQAVFWADQGLAVFPNARSFLWPKGDALYHQKKYAQAAEIYQQILALVLQTEYNNGYYEMLLYLKLARCRLYENNFEQAKYYCIRVNEKTPFAEVKFACEEKKRQAKELLSEIEQAVSGEHTKQPPTEE